MRTIQDLTQRVRAEYLETPGLRLTAEQVQGLCGIERMICQLVLHELVTAKFLRVKPDGQYIRLTEGRVPRPTPERADLRTGAPSTKAS
jgi:hypothetical protein